MGCTKHKVSEFPRVSDTLLPVVGMAIGSPKEGTNKGAEAHKGSIPYTLPTI
jgi:hypothetical protein